MVENEPKVAYFRYFEATKQCELAFHLITDLEHYGHFDEEIKAVRQVTDTVESLLNHIIQKINKIIKTDDDKPMDEITLSLINANKNKRILSRRILMNLFQNNMNLQFNILDQSFPVIINAPLIKELCLPTVIYAGFTVQPRLFKTIHTNSKESKFIWYKSKDKQKWLTIGDKYSYKTTVNDIGYYLKLKCIPFKHHLRGPVFEVVSTDVVSHIEEIPHCPFEDRQKFTTEKLTGNQFRIVSYNVLSNRYANTNDQFPYCTEKALSIDYRKQLIAKELLGYNADIICLQELDCTQFVKYYKKIFKDEGYMSFYHKKGNRIPEGLACFFNQTRYKKIDDHQLVYCHELQSNKQFHYLWNKIKGNNDVKNSFLRQAASLQITVLKDRNEQSKNSLIIIGNTHLFYHPEAEHIRLLQINIATSYLNTLKKHYTKTFGNNVTVILCGDFNCTPKSEVYNFVINGEVDNGLEVVKKLSDSLHLFHAFDFISACGQPKYTNYTQDFKDCLDYIFIEKSKVNIVNVVPFPKDEELAIYEGLPNEVYPSDHLALIVDLELI